MGVVYLARDEQLGREVAIKVIAPGVLVNEEGRSQFRSEAQLLAKLNHPAIDMVFDFGTLGDRDFIVLEYVPGQTLREILNEGALAHEQVLRIGIMLASGLEAAHSRGILHRDIKPGNLILTPAGQLKILDFGIAIAQASDTAMQPEIRTDLQEKRLAGTLPYMPPEQLSGERHDLRGDLYSSGVVLFEMATGTTPFAANRPSELIDSILHEEPPSPCSLNPNVSPLLEAVLLKALQKNPRDRHQKAAELRDELERVYAQERTGAPARAFDQSQSPVLEMSYVLFMDIVGYSRLATDSQQQLLRQLQRIVRGTKEFQRAQKEGRLIRLPTGDGLALAFFTDPEAPVRCALEISRTLQEQQDIGIRMGIHAGPVYRVADINGNQNIAGEGINVAQRVMDCGDAGHILVSKAVADVLGQLTGWSGSLHDLGTIKVKHGLEIHLFNLLHGDFGNPALPQKVAGDRMDAQPLASPRRRDWKWLAGSLGVALVLLILSLSVAKHWLPQSNQGAPDSSHTLRPTVAILGFKNLAGTSDSNWVATSISEMLTNELEAGNHVITSAGENVARAKMDLSLPDDTSYSRDTLRRIQQTLHCDYVIYGGIFAPGKQAGGTVRLDLRLQDATSGETLYSETETGTELKLEQIASMVGASLRSKLGVPGISPSESAAIQAASPSTLEATKFFYEGIERFRRFDFLGARDVLQQAVTADPNFALAHASLAEVWSKLGYDDRAREEARQAFGLSSHLSRDDRLLVEARYREIATEWDKAIEIYRALWTFYPENPEYALRAADVLIRAERGNDALKTIETLRQQPGPISKDPRLDLKEAEAAEVLSDFTREKQSAARSANGAKARGSRLLEAEALWRACAAMANLGEATEAQPACQRSIELAKPAGDLLLVARSFSILGRIAAAQGDPKQGLDQHRQALEFARTIGSRRDVVGALTNIGNSLANEGELAEAQKSFGDALAVAREINDQGQAITLLNNLATLSQALGRFSAAMHLYQQSLDAARAVMDKGGIARAQNNIGVLYDLQGNFPSALQNIQQAIDGAAATGDKSDQAQFLYALGDARLQQGDLPAAEANYQAGLNMATLIGEKSTVALGQLSLSELRLQAGNAMEAESLARKAADEFHAEGMKDQECTGRNIVASALIDLGRQEDASKELNLIAHLSPQDPTVRLPVAITAGRLDVRSGRVREGNKGFVDVAGEAKKLGIPSLQFEARLGQGESALLLGQRQAGISILSALEKDAAKKGLKQYEVRARKMTPQGAGT